jgi:hypothetical protein
MAFEINLEVYTFQVRNKRDKDFFYTLDNFLEKEDIIPFFKDFLGYYSKMTVSERQQKSIQFTDKIRITSDQRIISGVLESGDYGVESKITDKEGNAKYIKKADELDIKPFYYLIWVPNGSNIGIFITQRLGIFGIHGIFTSHFAGFFKEKYPDLMVDFNAYVSKEIARKFIEGGGIREIILRRFTLPSDIADKFDLNFDTTKIKSIELRILAENKTYFGINDRAKRFLDDENARLFTFKELEEIGFDGNHRELIKVKLGKNTRTIDLSQTAQLRPYFDIDSDVERQENGHPVFESIDRIARDLVVDLQEEISNRK